MKKVLVILMALSSTIFSMERPALNSGYYENEDYNSLKNGNTPNYLSRPYPLNFSPSSNKKIDNYIRPEISFSPRIYSITGSQIETLNYHNYSQWINNDPLLNLGFTAGNELFTIHYNLDVRHDFFSGYKNESFTNIPNGDTWTLDFDFNFPTRGYISFGNDYLELFAGRDKISYGPGKRTNLMLSPEAPFFNQLSLTYYSKHIKSSLFFIPMESYLTASEKKLLSNFIATKSDLLLDVNYEKDFNTQSKYLAGHRFEFKPLNNLIISFTEMLVLGGRFSNFEDITPSMFYHNVYGENYSNVMIGFDFYYAIISGLGLYGEIIIDDIRNSKEIQTTVPTSTAFLIGSEYQLPFIPFPATFHLEGADVSRFTYKRWHPYMNFYSRRKLFSTSTSYNGYLDSPNGFFLGADSAFIACWLSIFKDSKITSEIGYEQWFIGENINILGDELILSYIENAPSSRKMYHNIRFDLTWNINKNIKLNLQDYFIFGELWSNYISLYTTFKL